MKRSLDLFKLFGTVIIETKDAIDALEETADKAEEASESVDDLGSESKAAGKTTLSSLLPLPDKFLKVATAAGAVVTAVGAIATAMVSVADNTREYRLEMGKLETAFTTSGHSAEAATNTYNELYSVLGETDRSVEASQHLARLCATEEELKQWTDICIGAFASFDDSLPIEGLVEAANETAKTGQLTGVLADALNWAGVNEEDFQAKLSACTTEQERASVITETMASLYGEVGDAYKKNNADVIAATEAQEKLNAAMARWGEICEPIVTMFREGLAAAINFAADAFEYLTDPVGTAARAIAGTSETSAEAAAKVADLQGKLSELAAIPPMLWTSEHTRQQQELSMALQEAESQYDQLVAAEQRAAQTAKTAADETANTLMNASEKIPTNSETMISAMAENMQNDTSMEVAAQEAVDRTATTMTDAVSAAGFDSAGVTGMQRFIDGINSMSGSVMAAVDRIASAAAQRMQQALNEIQRMAANAQPPGFSVGLDYVPYDEFPALLHKGEAVLTAAEAAVWRAGKKSGEAEAPATTQQQTSTQSGITIVQNIQTVPQTPVEFAAATQAYFEQARWSMA